MVIDTGDSRSIAVCKPHYGLHESPIMQKTIDKLLDLGFIKHDTTSHWGFRITLAPKPHQESVTNIDECIWRFCINYIRLNMMTKPAEYPIPRCDNAVMYGFESAVFFHLARRVFRLSSSATIIGILSQNIILLTSRSQVLLCRNDLWPKKLSCRVHRHDDRPSRPTRDHAETAA